VVRLQAKAVAAGLLVHGWKMTEIPSASLLRIYNSTCANMLMYWNLLELAIERGQEKFDLGRSKPETSVSKFKEQRGLSPRSPSGSITRVVETVRTCGPISRDTRI
jgi:hypothetical protein